MGRNLGPLNIKDSYEGLVQISGSQLTNGSGSLIPSLEVTSSYATTAISASFATTSISASHAVNSNTAISASYAVTASYAENAGSSTLQQVLDTGNNATGSIVLKNNEVSLPALQINSPTGTSSTLLRLSRLGDSANNFVVTAGDATNATLSMGVSGGFGQINLNGTGTNKIQATTDLIIDTPSLTVTGALTASGLIYPTVDGTVGQVVTTDGAGNLTLEDAGGGGAAFPYTGSAQITGSLSVTGSASIGGKNNTISSTGFNNVILNDSGSITGTASHSFIAAGGEESVSTISAGVRNSMISTRGGSISGGARNSSIISGLSNTISGNSNLRQAIILGSRSSTITGGGAYGQAILGSRSANVSHANSVVIGGNGLSSSKDNEVVVPALSTNAQVKGNVVVLTSVASATTMDCSLGNFFTLTMPSGGFTELTPTNITAGQTISVKITQNATPSSLSFAPAIVFDNASPFVVSTSAGFVDVITFISFDGTSLQATGLKNFQ